MSAGKRIACFFIAAVLIYALLMFAWPLVASTYGESFRFATQVCFEHDIGSGSVRILPLHPSQAHDPKLDTQLDLINRKTKIEGHHPISSRFVGYVPTAMLMALVFATPVPLARRWNALLWGLLLIHVFIAFRIGLILLADFTSAGINAFSLGAFGHGAVSFLAELVSVSLFGCYFGPILIWVVVTFRAGDWALLEKQ